MDRAGAAVGLTGTLDGTSGSRGMSEQCVLRKWPRGLATASRPTPPRGLVPSGGTSAIVRLRAELACHDLGPQGTPRGCPKPRRTA